MPGFTYLSGGQHVRVRLLCFASCASCLYILPFHSLCSCRQLRLVALVYSPQAAAAPARGTSPGLCSCSSRMLRGCVPWPPARCFLVMGAQKWGRERGRGDGGVGRGAGGSWCAPGTSQPEPGQAHGAWGTGVCVCLATGAALGSWPEHQSMGAWES